MQGWNPEPERPFDLEWLQREDERLRREAEEKQEALENAEIVRGPGRGDDGRFVTNPDRVCRTDGVFELSLDEYEELLLRIVQCVRRARGMSPVRVLEAAKALRELYDAFEYEAVAIARGYGWPWRAIGDALGISESAAHRRFGSDFARRERQRRRRRS
jgi:hypothetical protein